MKAHLPVRVTVLGRKVEEKFGYDFVVFVGEKALENWNSALNINEGQVSGIEMKVQDAEVL